MPPELVQWVSPAIIILGFLYALRSMKQIEARLESRMDRMETRVRQNMEDLRGEDSKLWDRIALLEGQFPARFARPPYSRRMPTNDPPPKIWILERNEETRQRARSRH